MNDALLSSTDREEALSRAYVAAVTAAAGYVTASMDFDRDGVDVQIRAGGSMNPSLDIQLKATINLDVTASHDFGFSLKRRNYDLLRVQTMVPRILVVLHLPTNKNDWLTVTPEHLMLRRCASWASLSGFPERENQYGVTVKIRVEDRFDVEGLKALMQRARTGGVA